MTRDAFRVELTALINRASAENASNTPDFALVAFLMSCLDAFNAAVNRRSEWYGRYDCPGRTSVKDRSPKEEITKLRLALDRWGHDSDCARLCARLAMASEENCDCNLEEFFPAKEMRP